MSHSCSRRGLSIGVLFAAMAQVLWPASATAQSLPNGVLSSNNVSGINTVANTMTVDVSAPRAFINWTTFDVDAGYTFQANGAGNFILLNRVLGGQLSSIDGLVQSSGNVWIVNSNGIAVGATGQFNVAGTLLSTADLTDMDFLDGNGSFNFSGASTNGIVISSGAQLQAASGGIFVLANQVAAFGSLQAAGTNALLGSRNMTVTFDANLAAITSLDLGSGSTHANPVVAGTGAAFSGTRTVLMAAGMSSGQGNVLLQNPGGANDIVFGAGAVELISRDADVSAQDSFATAGDLSINAAGMFWGDQQTVGGNYSITAQDFSGGLQPVFIGSNNSFSITDTAFGLTISGLTAPGDINVTTTNGGPLTISNGMGATVSTNGNINLTADGGLTVGGSLTTATTAGHAVTLTTADSITQSGGVITTHTLDATASNAITLGGANQFAAAEFSTSIGNISANAASAFNLLGASSGGTLDLSAPTIGLAAATVAAAGNVTFDAAIGVSGINSVTSSGGSVLFDGTVDGPGRLTATSASGTTFNNDVGASTALDTLTLTGASAQTFKGSQLRTVNGLTLVNATFDSLSPVTIDVANAGMTATSLTVPNADLQLSTAGNIALGSFTVGDYDNAVSHSSVVDAGTGSVTLGNAYVGPLQVDAGNQFLVTGALRTPHLSGTIGGTATLAGNNQIDALGTLSANGLTVRNLNALAVDGVVDAGAGDARIEVVGNPLQIDATGQVRGNNVALSAAYLLNDSGNDGVVANGHWVIYQASANPLAQYDGLDSGATALWGKTISTLVPTAVSGNRYVFATQPTLTLTTTNTSKTYGTDLTGTTTGLYTLSGLQPGVAGAYLGDTAASALSGAPLLTSSGFGTHAAVAGGPYAINIAAGTLTSPGGYNLAFSSAGALTVTAKALTASATASKTYDGNTSASGAIVLSGVVGGDSVGASGSLAFADKSAGLGKTLNLSGLALSGADAGNYTLNATATASGDILQKALTGTASANNKTYDGTTTATGSIALNGVVAGDSVRSSGNFAFADKNAGSGKLVTVSGIALTGADAGNYTINTPTAASADIAQKSLTGTATVSNKTYDGNSNAAGSIALDGVVAGDSVDSSGTFAFADKNAGSGKLVTVSGVTLTGADAGNYTLSVPASALADILKKSISGTAAVSNKTYDGSTAASGAIALDGVIGGDSVNATGSYAFSDANAGAHKTVAVSDVSVSGADANNYSVIVSGATVADILQRAITVTANAASKNQGSADPALSYGVTAGALVAGESLSGALSRTAGEAPGAYAIGQGTLAATSNYQLTFVGATLTIAAVASNDPTDGLVVNDELGGAVRFVGGGETSSAATAAPLEIADERACEMAASRSAACRAGRPQ